MTTPLEVSLAAIVGDPARVSTVPQVVNRLSRDFYWYSPVLRKQLDGKIADVVVHPLTVQEIQDVLRYCYANDIPVTRARRRDRELRPGRAAARGSASRPLAHGSDRIHHPRWGCGLPARACAWACSKPRPARLGWELRCYPSTIVKASVGGFLGGGSGGIGSVAHGGLRDFATVRALDVVTMEDPPRVVHHEGEAIHEILHAWGTNGIITRIWLALTPSVEWAQCAVAFDTFDQAFDFSERIATSEEWTKRLVTTFEWPIPSFFTPVRTLAPEGKALIFFMIAEDQRTSLESGRPRGRRSSDFLRALRRACVLLPLLSDYTWNHTTLWAMKADPEYTYLQCGFDAVAARSQFARLKQRFGDEFLFHLEFMKNGQGVVFPGSIPVVRFSTEERLNEMIDYCREIGVSVANPHVNNVEGGGRYRSDNVQLLAKHKYDTKGLLNPGKMVTFERHPVGAPIA